MTSADSIDFLFSGFEACLSTDPSAIATIGIETAIPEFSEPTLIKLCESATDRFKEQTTILMLDAPLVIVGDIHGSLHDLLRILQSRGLNSRYLFLGDYVDRGEYSIECITLLFVLTCKFPDCFFLLRGNHESVEICSEYGFRSDILSLYSESLFEAFCTAFSWLPLAAVVRSELFCVHGGLGPGVIRLEHVSAIPRPTLCVRDIPTLHTILWADPDVKAVRYGLSGRDGGITFGVNTCHDFLRVNNLQFLVRAHECVKDGVQRIQAMSVITVFSASSYQMSPINSSGILLVPEEGEIRTQTFPPLPRLPRGHATFYSMKQSVGEAPLDPGLPALKSATLRMHSSRSVLGVPHGISRSSTIGTWNTMITSFRKPLAHQIARTRLPSFPELDDTVGL
jgi:protein phosphatase